jgi:hypothetical protein
VANKIRNGYCQVKERRKLNKWQKLSVMIGINLTEKVINSSIMNHLPIYIFIKVVHFIDFTFSECVKFSYSIIGIS